MRFRTGSIATSTRSDTRWAAIPKLESFGPFIRGLTQPLADSIWTYISLPFSARDFSSCNDKAVTRTAHDFLPPTIATSDRCCRLFPLLCDISTLFAFQHLLRIFSSWFFALSYSFNFSFSSPSCSFSFSSFSRRTFSPRDAICLHESTALLAPQIIQDTLFVTVDFFNMRCIGSNQHSFVYNL